MGDVIQFPSRAKPRPLPDHEDEFTASIIRAAESFEAAKRRLLRDIFGDAPSDTEPGGAA